MSSEPCRTCNRNPRSVNSQVAECSHVDCPHRRRQWSEGPTAPRWKTPPRKQRSPAEREFDDAEV